MVSRRAAVARGRAAALPARCVCATVREPRAWAAQGQFETRAASPRDARCDERDRFLRTTGVYAFVAVAAIVAVARVRRGGAFGNAMGCCRFEQVSDAFTIFSREIFSSLSL